MFPFQHRGRVVIVAPPPADVVAARLRAAFAARRHVQAELAAHRIPFTRGWRADLPTTGYEPMMLVDSGEVAVLASGPQLHVEYRLRFVRAAWACLAMVIAVHVVLSLTTEGPAPPVGTSLAFLAIAWSAGFGMIRYRAHAFVPHWLRRSATSPGD